MRLRRFVWLALGAVLVLVGLAYAGVRWVRRTGSSPITTEVACDPTPGAVCPIPGLEGDQGTLTPVAQSTPLSPAVEATSAATASATDHPVEATATPTLNRCE